MAGALWADGEPPVHDSIRISAAVLVQGETAPAPAFSGEWTKSPSKKLPSSISVFLKPSKVIDSNNPTVRKAAREALGLLGPGLTKFASEDPRLLAGAVKAWVAGYFFPPDEDYIPRPYATDARILVPKASRLIAIQQADPSGKARVRIALLRALGVPARAARLRGRPAVQYWAQWINDVADKSSKVKGEWVLDEQAFPGESPEAWALDSGDLAPAIWMPEQELAYEASLQRAYFSLSETAEAMDALDYVKKNGSLPLSVTARVMPPHKGPWLLLANHRARFYTEGSMEALMPLELLLPYRPKLASWGSQQRPIPDTLATLASGYWTDRPDRVRGKKGSEWGDEYKSPPPAYGVLHYASLSLRKPAQVLEVHLLGKHLKGKLLRRDSLAIRDGWDIKVEFPSLAGWEPKVAKTDSKGTFDIELSDSELKGRWIKVLGGQGAFDVSRWDTELIETEPVN